MFSSAFIKEKILKDPDFFIRDRTSVSFLRKELSCTVSY